MHTSAAHAPAHTGPTLLESVAAHEASLIARVAETEQAGRKLVDDAQSAAAAFLTDDYAQLEREAAEMRRRAADEREAEAAAIRRACDDKVVAIRSQASKKLDQVFAEVVRRVLPRA